VIRDVAPADLPAILALNNQHAAEVNALTLGQLEDLLATAARARVIVQGASPLAGHSPASLPDTLGFVIALDERTPPHGPNHEWFLARERAFVYVDRIVIAPDARGRGFARALYEDLADGRPLCCEVNLDPPNPGSLAFHERLGFRAVGEATDPRNGKRVRYLTHSRWPRGHTDP
jgi:predicted GNAT superfamily acetyltransferase